MPARRRRAPAASAEVARYAVRRVLLDTHTWLWWMTNDPRLGDRASTLIRRADEAHFSAASAWEISIKAGIGKLELPSDLDLAQEVRQGSFLLLPVTIEHAVAIRALPSLHRDPFDRMLVAQARVEGLTIISADTAIMRYDVPAIDARN